MAVSPKILEAKALAYFYIAGFFETNDPDLSDLIHDLGFSTKANDLNAFFETAGRIKQHLKEKHDE